MPSLLHETLLLLFRNRPDLAPQLVREALRGELPHYSDARIESAELNEVQPTEYRADLVVVLRQEKPVFGIVVEVQLGSAEDKLYSWPAYTVNLRARLRCPVCLLVITAEESVARWAREPIELGGGNRWRPWVIGPAVVPEVLDETRARKEPELAVLSAMAHGQDADPSKAAQIAYGAKLASLGLDADRRQLYYDLAMMTLTEVARRALESMDPAKHEYLSPFAREYFGQGKAEGKAEGQAEGRAEIVIKLLALRFGPLSAEAEARIRAAGIEELDDMAVRVLTASTLDEALAAE